jgi:endonuclease/exonuclease/phosphatase (EEP) superfamily protein YafD
MLPFVILMLLQWSPKLYGQVYENDYEVFGKFWVRVKPESKSLLTHGISRERELPRKMRALIWNIKKTEKVLWQSEFIKYAFDKHLILVQEAYETDLFKSTLESFPLNQWSLGASFFYLRYDDRATGTMVGAKAIPTESFVKHSPDTEPLLGTPKSSTFSKFAVEGIQEELLVISLHGINFETKNAFKRQMIQISNEIATHAGPILFAGDFNTWSDARTDYLLSMTKKLALKEANYINGEHRTTFSGNYLDHVFYRGLSLEYVEVVKDSKGSDHRPFLMEFTIP